jgi:ATP-dependent Clp protease ATP-binding subunit ClpA
MKGIKLEYTPDVLEVIAKKSYGKSSGARDIRRIMRDEVEDKIASLIIDNMDQISEISMTVENDSVKVENITENN